MLQPWDIWTHLCHHGYITSERRLHRVRATLREPITEDPILRRAILCREMPTGDPRGGVAWYVEIETIDVNGIAQTRTGPKRFDTLDELDRLLPPTRRLEVVA